MDKDRTGCGSCAVLSSTMMITETIKLRTADPARTNSAGETRSGATVVGTKMIETIKSASEVKKRILVVRPQDS